MLRQIVFALTPSDLKTGLFRLMKMVFVEITTETEEEEAVSLRELNPVKVQLLPCTYYNTITNVVQ